MLKKKRRTTMGPSSTVQPNDNSSSSLADQIHASAKKTKKLKLNKSYFNNPYALAFIIVFAVIGSYLLFKSFASSAVGQIEGEALQGSGTVINDPLANGASALKLITVMPATGNLATSALGTTVILHAKGTQCNGAPQAQVNIDGSQVLLASVSGTTWGDYTANFNVTQGTHSLSAIFTNPYSKSGKGKSNKGACTRELYIDYIQVLNNSPPPPPSDSTPPTILLTSPGNGSTLTGTVNVTANASDNVGVTKVEFYIDNSLTSTVTASPFNYTWDTTKSTNASHTIKVIAYDAANNSANASETVNVNNPVAASAFVTSGGFGTNAYVVNGQSFHSYGSTMYPDGGGTLWHHSDFTTYIDDIISRVKVAHLNTIRVTDYLEGLKVYPTDIYNPIVWANMDYLVNKAKANNIYVIMDASGLKDLLKANNMYIYNPSYWTDFINFLGNRYKDATNILDYSITGEVPCPTGTDPLKPNSTADVTNFYTATTNTLWAADQGHHLITAGGLSHLNQSNCGIDWQAIFSLPHVSTAAIHVYSGNDENITTPMVSKWAQANNKPFEIQEFGFTQDGSKTLCPTDPNPDVMRACAYQRIYTLAKTYNAGMTVFWNNGPQLAPTSYQVNPNTPLTWQTIINNAP